jgi:saccharopine dehydrogenase-like NADP-dependent oxidoreductase
MVGGIPQKPIPPFNYRITWSPADLLDEYIRPTRVMVNGRIKNVPTLSGVDEFNVAGVGRLESFYTDGLRTLLRTIKAGNMEEKTIRYSGHVGIIQTILNAGFADLKNTVVRGKAINRREFLIEFLKEELSRGSIEDLTILIVELARGGRKRRYLCVDRYDRKNKITSMARMTGYSAVIMAQCVKKYPNFGVVPPEYLGMNDGIYRFIIDELSRYNIKIKRS